MEPIQDFTKILSPHLQNDKIKIFNCDHIIPDKNLKVFQISNYNNNNNNNNNNTVFDFSFKNRYNEKMLINLGFLILNYIKIIPKGLVLFFTSYKYLEYIIKIWEKNNILNEFKKFKKIFTESKEVSTDKLLSDYSFEINGNSKDAKGGAVLFSVIGGKLSEGINFSNDLARSVILIGLPYPNVYSGELIARKNYIYKRSIEMGDSNSVATKKSNELVENICMKAVNQSVGRAIRNIKDYAVIMLIDYRYKQTNIENKLSHWIRKRIIRTESNEIVNREIADFFKDRKTE
ncbi:unnamed protein product [[Candida] boidinii]|nr:unnamed protein product [[Candida] boidinii]